MPETVEFLKRCAERSDIVTLTESGRPVIYGDDGKYRLLLEIVSELHFTINYPELQKRFPSLSIIQLIGAVDFLEQLCHFNTASEGI